MKKILVLFCCVALLGVVGCGEKEMSAEDFGKKYMEEKFAGQDVDLLKLDYKVVEGENDTATVVIEGTIKYKEEIILAKKGLSWVVMEKAPEAAEAAEEAEVAEEVAEPAEHAVEEEAVAHGAEVEAEKEHAVDAETAHEAPKAEHH